MDRAVRVVLTMEQTALRRKKVNLDFLNERQGTTIGNHQENRHPLGEVEEVVDLVTENNYGTSQFK